ncbi:hypothetical protein Tco_0778910 [Tanacetum coccineum]
MTKVIKGEFEKIKNVKVEDVSLTCDTPLEVFNNEVSRLSGMDDDLFTYEVEVAKIPRDSNMDDDSEHEADDDMGYDPSDVAFTEWLGSKNLNYMTMDHYTMKALWIYWIRGDDEVELTDEESSNDEDEIVEDYEWYEALEDCELKDKALRNKAIMEGFIKEVDVESQGILVKLISTGLCAICQGDFVRSNILFIMMKSMLLLKEENSTILQNNEIGCPVLPRNLSDNGRRMDGDSELNEKEAEDKSNLKTSL